MKNWSKLFPYLILCLIVGFFTSYHLWRISTPLENRLTINRLMFNESDYHDSLAAYQTAKNYYQDGWSKEYSIPNRKGVITQGYWGIPCAKDLPPPSNKDFILVPHPNGTMTTIYSDNKDCFYTHNPPLTDWLWGGFYQLGFRSFIDFKHLAVIFNALTCLALLMALLQYFSFPAVAIGGGLWMSLYYQTVWSSSLYHHPWQYLFVACLIISAKKEHRLAYSISSFFVFFTNLFLVAIPFIGLVLIPKKKRFLFFLSAVSAASIAFSVFYIQRAFFFHSLTHPFADIFSDALNRYQTVNNFFEIFKGYINAYFGNAYVLSALFVAGLYYSFKEKVSLSLFFILSAISLWLLRPSYALAHIHQWFSLFCFVYLIFAVVIIHSLIKNDFHTKNLLHILPLFIIFIVLFYENGSRFYSDFLYTKELKRFNEINDLSKKPLVLLFSQIPHSENPWTDFEKSNVLIDGILRQVQFPHQIRPTAIELRGVKQFSIYFHFLEEQTFNTITFDFLGSLPPQSLKCQLTNFSSNALKISSSPYLQSPQRFSLTFSEQIGKSFNLDCLAQTDIVLYEMGVFRRE